MRVYVTSVKKVLDFVIALIGVCFLSPFLSFVALLLFIAASEVLRGFFLFNLEWDIKEEYLKY